MADGCDSTAPYADTMRALEALQTYAPFRDGGIWNYLFAFESKRTAVMDSIVTDETTGKKDGHARTGAQAIRGWRI
jgi:hypothetical protein